MNTQHPAFVELEVSHTRAETHELTHLELAGASPEMLAAYQIPGQYLMVKTDEPKPGFFAIACGPGRRTFELLVKGGSPVSDAIRRKKEGERLAVSLPQGKGFPMHEAAGRNVILVGVGSGITPLRAAMHSLLANREKHGRITMVYGARTCDAIPYNAEMDSWLANGVEVSRVCSRPGPDTWSGAVGRVQDVLLSRGESLDRSTAVFVCGMKAMVEDVKATFVKLELPPDRIFLNF